MKYSILITVYNKEQYLERCLYFVCNQSYKNYDVIVVNDGSTDKSHEILKKYQKKYGFKYFNKKNSGIADTRNFIISKVQTPYFMFVDADDYISIDCLRVVDNHLTKDCEMLSFNATFYNSDYSIKKRINKPVLTGDGVNFFSECIKVACDFVFPWGYVYKTDFFRNHNFKYHKGYLLDDFCVTPFVILECKNFISIDYDGYYYFEVPNSIMTKKGNDKIMYQTYEDFYDMLLEENFGRSYSDEGKKLYHYYLIYTLLWVGENYSLFEQIKLLKRMKKQKMFEILKKRGNYEKKICFFINLYLYYPYLKIHKFNLKIKNHFGEKTKKYANLCDEQLAKMDESLKLRGYTKKQYLLLLKRMTDKESKELLQYRVMHGLTENPYFSLKLVQESIGKMSEYNLSILNMKYLVEYLLKDNNYSKKIYFIGQNDIPIRYVLNFSFYMDKQVKGILYPNGETAIFRDEFSRIPLIKVSDDYIYECDAIYIITDQKYNYMSEKLKQNGIWTENIYCPVYNWPWLNNLQYFGETIIKPIANDVYVDCGVYNMDSIENFIAWSQNKYKRIYGFEPHSELYEAGQKIIQEKNIENVELYNLAVWKEKNKLRFTKRDYGASTVSESIRDKNNNVIVNANSLDNVLKSQKVTLIKYDIEGAEYEALLGSSKTIKDNSPAIMIAVYHFPLDVLKIGLELLKINPNYHFYLRHQGYTSFETVLYCYVPGDKHFLNED